MHFRVICACFGVLVAQELAKELQEHMIEQAAASKCIARLNDLDDQLSMQECNRLQKALDQGESRRMVDEEKRRRSALLQKEQEAPQPLERGLENGVLQVKDDIQEATLLGKVKLQLQETEERLEHKDRIRLQAQMDSDYTSKMVTEKLMSRRASDPEPHAAVSSAHLREQSKQVPLLACVLSMIPLGTAWHTTTHTVNFHLHIHWRCIPGGHITIIPMKHV